MIAAIVSAFYKAFTLLISLQARGFMAMKPVAGRVLDRYS